jgi:formylglycine-generating enzyme required for sulfatase activity
MSEIVTNSVGMEFVPVPVGTFTMGGDPVAEQADENERPRHKVAFENPFLIGKYTVTQSQWQAIMETNPSHFKETGRPVEMVSYEDAGLFVDRLNHKEDTHTYRLPTEAQWEYAARAGSQSTYCFGSERMKLGKYAWFRKNSAEATHPVGLLLPNEWGIHDMHGNVHEWCADWFDRNYYAGSPLNDPRGPEKGLARTLRGGDWGSEEWYCRCAIRSLSSPDRRSPRVGFRVVILTDL